MKQFSAFLFALITINSFAQIRFEKGYFIDNAKQRTECLIRNEDWNDTPKSFVYKLTEGGETILKDATNTMEFGVGSESKYIRADIDLDRYSNKLGSLSRESTITYSNERQFIKILVEGTETLYVYDESGLNRYFFKNNQNEIKPLVYRKYTPEGSDVVENNQFRNQLWNDVRCEKTELKTVERLHYVQSELVAYFKSVNNCNNSDTKTLSKFEAKNKKGQFNVKAAVGISQYGLDINRMPANNSSSMSKTGMFLGLEAEYILPTNKNKIAVIIEPNYNTFKEEQELQSSFINGNNIEVNYNFLEFPVGLRYYFFLTAKSKIFLTGMFVSNFQFGSTIGYRSLPDVAITPYTYNFAGGIGYNYERFSVEVRTYSSRGVADNLNIDSGFEKLSFIFRYKIFQK